MKKSWNPSEILAGHGQKQRPVIHIPEGYQFIQDEEQITEDASWPNISDPYIEKALEAVSDPEIPVLSVLDMGIIRRYACDGKKVELDITPTYSGCPAMDTIAQDLALALQEIGLSAEIKLVMSPAWSTDWISPRGRKHLEEYGIATPLTPGQDKRALMGEKKVLACTLCGSKNTRLISPFGSTACKALFQCDDCGEPFDYFKCLQ